MDTVSEIRRLRAEKSAQLTIVEKKADELKKSINAYDIVLLDLENLKNSVEKIVKIKDQPKESKDYLGTSSEPKQQRIRKLPADEVENALLTFGDIGYIITPKEFEEYYIRNFGDKITASNFKSFLRRLVNNQLAVALVLDGNFYFALKDWFNENGDLDTKYLSENFDNDISEVEIVRYFERTS